jgi:hypothetical protein
MELSEAPAECCDVALYLLWGTLPTIEEEGRDSGQSPS